MGLPSSVVAWAPAGGARGPVGGGRPLGARAAREAVNPPRAFPRGAMDAVGEGSRAEAATAPAVAAPQMVRTARLPAKAVERSTTLAVTGHSPLTTTLAALAVARYPGGGAACSSPSAGRSQCSQPPVCRARTRRRHRRHRTYRRRRDHYCTRLCTPARCPRPARTRRRRAMGQAAYINGEWGTK